MNPNEPTTEPCQRCGRPIIKGEGICDDCKDELNYEDYREKMELHERYVEAARRGEL